MRMTNGVEPVNEQERELSLGMVGLGDLGAIVAEKLVAGGHEVCGWDKRPEAMERLVAAGGTAARDLAALAGCDLVFSMVFDDESTREIALAPGGLVATMPAGGIHVLMASVSPGLASELEAAHAEHGQHLLSASVFGRPEAARAAALLINCSGAESAYSAAEPFLGLLGSARWIGPRADQAMLVKTIGNSLIHTTVEMLREMFEFLQAGGIDGPLAKELLVDRLFSGPIATSYAQRYLDDPRSAAMIDMARKDRQICLDAALDMDVALPVIQFLGEQDLP